MQLLRPAQNRAAKLNIFVRLKATSTRYARTRSIMFRHVFALLFIGSFPHAHASCSRSSSHADICCADGASHTFGTGVVASAFCRITEITSASDCPPGWTFNEDGEKSNCQRALSTEDGEGSGESTTLNVGTLNVCPNGNRAHVGVAPSPCGDYGAVARISNCPRAHRWTFFVRLRKQVQFLKQNAQAVGITSPHKTSAFLWLKR